MENEAGRRSPEAEGLVTLAELAKHLHRSQRTVYNYIGKGRITGLRVGGGWRFKLSEVEEQLREEAA